jgi:SsrA-binding protein
MAKHKAQQPADENTRSVCRNRRAGHEYEILEKLECGIVLTGSEVKSIRDGKISIEEAYAKVVGDELWLIGCDIAEYPQASLLNHEPRRNRKLLLHRRELRKFAESAAHQGLTLIPLAVYLLKGKVKVEIAVGRGRKLHDKREKLKQDAAQAEMRRAMASRR